MLLDWQERRQFTLVGEGGGRNQHGRAEFTVALLADPLGERPVGLGTDGIQHRFLGTLGVCSLFGVYSVKIINDMDRCTRDAQDLLLSYLDRLPPGRAVIGTSNLQLDLLTESFQTR